MPCFIHADLDAFYAAVETLDHPEYRGKPLIVGGLPSDRRSVVATASYEARVFGVHSAMPVAQAVKLCPQAVFLRGNMRRYQQKSGEIMSIFGDFSPDVMQLSIDEAFLDISGMEGLFGPPDAHAQKLKDAVLEKTGLTVSCGAASNKYLAKIASGIKKPGGLCYIPPGGEADFMLPLPVEKIWGAGKKTQEIFRKKGFRICADIAALSLESLVSVFGNAAGIFLYRAVRGQAAESFDRERGGHSMSAERTFEYDLSGDFEIESALLEICQTVFWRVLRDGLESRTISVKIRYGDFSTGISRETFPESIATLNGFYEKVMNLFRRKYHGGEGVRLLGAGLMNLASRTARQGDLFGAQSKKEQALEKTILEINRKFPRAALRRAGALDEGEGRFGTRKE